MKYVSTRDETQQTYSFSDVLLRGLADDGGLFVPELFPEFSIADIHRLKSLTYPELAYKIISRFVGECIPAEDLKGCMDRAYTAAAFQFDSITPVETLYPHMYLQDLSTGPSLAFKDLAMQFLGQIMDMELKRRGKQLTILGASSGDTVSAAEEAMRGKEAIKVVMLTPKEGMSAFQKAQAGSILDPGIFNVSIQGSFDVCQDIVKEINGDLTFKEQHHIGAVNSINWGRICAQVVYYFKGYFSVVPQVNQLLDVVVPSGNFGNILAAYVAKQMGLPLRHLIVATNENRVLHQVFQTAMYEQKDVVVTSSPSMDISKASNIERLFFDLLGRDAALCKNLMNTFALTKSINLSAYKQTISEKGFRSGATTHADRIATIKRIYDDTERVIDPHTAAGIKVAFDLPVTDVPVLCMETAKPSKFESAIEEALGLVPPRPDRFKNLESQEQRFYDVEATAAAVKAFIAEHIPA